MHAQQLRSTTRALPDVLTNLMLRGGVALGLVAIALIHFLDLFSKFKETPYLGVAYVGLIVLSLVMAARLLRSDTPRVWAGAAGLAAATLAGYALSRFVGLPGAHGDIGNWTEPLGLASLFVEAVVVALSAYATTFVRRAQTTAPRLLPAMRISLPSSV